MHRYQNYFSKNRNLYPSIIFSFSSLLIIFCGMRSDLTAGRESMARLGGRLTLLFVTGVGLSNLCFKLYWWICSRVSLLVINIGP